MNDCILKYGAMIELISDNASYLKGPPAPLPVLEPILFEDGDIGPELFDITDLDAIAPAQELEELLRSPDIYNSPIYAQNPPAQPQEGLSEAMLLAEPNPEKDIAEQPDRVRRLLIVELMRLDHAIAFREASRSIIDELLNGNYVIEENSLPQTRLGYVPSVVLPRSRPHFPVLYQVVNKGSGHRVVLEAKDFFIPGPDRRELNLIILDQYATNIQSFTRGFDKFLLSVMDFVWIYSVDPTNTALRDPSTVLTQARVPKATALDTRFPYFFRVREFTLVTPAAAVRRILGIVMSRVVRFDTVKGLTIAFEGAPEAVSVSPSICKFRVSDAELDEIVTAISRPNISYAIRFPEFPSSKEAQRTLCALVCVRLAPPTVGAEPLHKLISQSQLFGEFPENSQATAVLDTIYGQQRIEVGPDGPQHKNVSVSVGGRSFTLREDQVAALEIGEHRLPILAIQAAFGTGKTVLGALIAGRTFSKFQERVIATTSTNTEVAQSTDTLLRLDEYRNIDILRYVSDSVLIEGAPQTPIDLHTILKRLPVDYADKLSEEALQTCRKYKRAVNYPKGSCSITTLQPDCQKQNVMSIASQNSTSQI
nr:unnamed protein product [Haemonchus contortus]